MYDLVIVGAGISGMRAAVKAAEQGVEKVLIVDYLPGIGGFTSPYFSSPHFEKETEQFNHLAMPYLLWTNATVVGLFTAEGDQPHQIYIHRPYTAESIETRLLLIASGSLEKPREAHRIPGTRPAGVMTPYLAMQFIKRGELPGRRILSIGDTRMHRAVEDQLKNIDCEVTCYKNHEVESLHILGNSRVTGASFIDSQTRETRTWEGDTIIYSKERIPCTFFLKGTQVNRDSDNAVIVDTEGRTNIPQIYAVGSCTQYGDENHSNSIDLVDKQLTALWKEL